MQISEYFEDIICARATPPGASAVAIIRVSGKECWGILKKIFMSHKNKIIYFASHRVYYGSILDNNREIVDSVIVLPFAESKSFTGEESFEINCHGSEVVVAMIFRILTDLGVRLAEPGEFSKRAFLNGKLSLAEAESIMDIVHSSTKRSAMIALRQLTGRLTREIDSIKDRLSDLLASIEVLIDYPEEDITEEAEFWLGEISGTKKELDYLINGFQRGRYYREGINAVILGKTNSGKSTLFNLLLNEDKAIVSDIHGTTRDYIDGVINISGYGVRIFDTAGLRETTDSIEYEGTKRAVGLSKNADFIFYVISSSEGLTTDDMNNLKQIDRSKKLLLIINKIDIDKVKDQSSIITFLQNNFDHYKISEMSALNKTGIDLFNKNFVEMLTNKDRENSYENDDPLITNSRHAALIEKTSSNMINAFQRVNEGTLDLAAFEIRDGINSLGEITGEVTPNDIIQRIFSNFCVGK